MDTIGTPIDASVQEAPLVSERQAPRLWQGLADLTPAVETIRKNADGSVVTPREEYDDWVRRNQEDIEANPYGFDFEGHGCNRTVVVRRTKSPRAATLTSSSSPATGAVAKFSGEGLLSTSLSATTTSSRPSASSKSINRGKNLAVSPAELDAMLPRPEAPSEARTDAAKDFMHKADAAYQNCVWMPDGSRHSIGMSVDKDALAEGTMPIEPKDGRTTLRIAYFFSGVTRKAFNRRRAQEALRERRVQPPCL